jgi:hypothetical protein
MSNDRKPTITGCVKLDQKVDAVLNRERASSARTQVEEILSHLSRPHADITWVGKNYSKLDLINALEELQENL